MPKLQDQKRAGMSSKDLLFAAIFWIWLRKALQEMLEPSHQTPSIFLALFRRSSQGCRWVGLR